MMTSAIRLLYLDDCDIDHRLMQAYLSLDDEHSYVMTTCNTLEEAREALQSQQFDALILDNRVPPYTNYHQTYGRLRETTGFDGCTVVISADLSGEEFRPDRRQGEEIIFDKAELLHAISDGILADAIRGSSVSGDIGGSGDHQH